MCVRAFKRRLTIQGRHRGMAMLFHQVNDQGNDGRFIIDHQYLNSEKTDLLKIKVGRF